MRAPVEGLPQAPERVLYSGPRHGGVRLAECRWRPSDGVEAGAFLDQWLDATRRAAMHGNRIRGILTCIDRGGRWVPLTVVTESDCVSGGLGMFLATPHAGGDLIGVALDAALLGRPREGSRAAAEAVRRAGGKHAERLFWRGKELRNGAWCRPGGIMAANDPRGTGQKANAELDRTGCLNVKERAGVSPLRADMTPGQRRGVEILWDYGDEYWR